jgi:peptide/nickel transport system substrate-binding protein
MKRLLRALLMSALIAAMLGACPAMASKDAITVGMSDTIPSMEIYQTSARVAIQFSYMVFDPLVERDPKTGEIKPHLATSWKNLNPTTWEFKLRSDVKFHNGSKFNAESVRYTIMDLILNPEYKSPQASGLKWVKDVRVIDEHTFQVITTEPYPMVLQRFNTLFPQDPKWTKEALSKEEGFLARNINGTGPFKFKKFVEGQRVELVKNENYWKKGVPAYNQLNIRFIPEESTRVAELISGGIHDADIGSDSVPVLNKSANVRTHSTPILRVVTFQFDSMGRAKGSPKELQDVRVRKAIWHAIDRKSIIDAVLVGTGSYLNTPINPMAFGCVPGMKGPEYDPAKAKSLMKEAGYEKGFTVNIWVFNNMLLNLTQAAMPFLEKINVKVKIRDYVGRYGEFAKAWRGGKTDGITGMSWGSYNIFDADALWSYFFMIPEAPFNYSNDKQLSDLLHAARETLDQAKRKDLYAKAQKRIMDQAYWLPLWAQNSLRGTNKHFQYDNGADEVPRWQYGKWVD